MGDTKPSEADSPGHRTWETNDRRQMMGDTEPREADTAPDTGHGRQIMTGDK